MCGFIALYPRKRAPFASAATPVSLFTRDQRGVTSVEFSLIVPVFLLLVMAIVEFSMIMFTSTVMESATNTTARLGKTGYIPPGMGREQAIINNIQTRTAGLLDPAKITVTSSVYESLNQIGQPEPCISPSHSPCGGTPGVNFVDVNGNGRWDADMARAGQGGAGEIVVYTAQYPWPVVTPIISAIIGRTFTISTRTVVKNEPFTVSR